MDVKLLLREGHSQREVARLTGLSRNTVARVVADPAPAPYQRAPGSSKLDPFKPYLERRFGECPLSAVRLLAEIRPMGYTGSIDLLRRFLATLRSSQRALTKATVRFETPPGQQAQVDWASCGTFPGPDGEPVKVYAFVMVLGFSRVLYVEFTTSMELPTLLACHQHAFESFGGWPRELLYDNMAQVRLTHSREWNPLFLDFAQHYGFTPKTCRVRRPRTKGKVERSIGYLKDSFLAGRTFADLADLQAQGQHWLRATANVRLHATTGCRPVDLLPAEELTPLSTAAPYRLSGKSTRKVSAEAYVHLGGARYSVAPEHVGKEVLIEAGEQQVRIRAGDLVLAEHRRAEKPGATVTHPEHAAACWKLCLPPGSTAPSEEREGVPPSWKVTFTPEVAVTPLSAYADAARTPLLAEVA